MGAHYWSQPRWPTRAVNRRVLLHDAAAQRASLQRMQLQGGRRQQRWALCQKPGAMSFHGKRLRMKVLLLHHSSRQLGLVGLGSLNLVGQMHP